MTDDPHFNRPAKSEARYTFGATNTPKRPAHLNSALNLAYFIINAIKANDLRENVDRYLDMWRSDEKFADTIAEHASMLHGQEVIDMASLLHLTGMTTETLRSIFGWPKEQIEENLENQGWLQRYLTPTVRFESVLGDRARELCRMLPLFQVPYWVREPDVREALRNDLCKAFNLTVEQLRQACVLFVACDEEAYELIGCLREYRRTMAAQEGERAEHIKRFQDSMDKGTYTLSTATGDQTTQAWLERVKRKNKELEDKMASGAHEVDCRDPWNTMLNGGPSRGNMEIERFEREQTALETAELPDVVLPNEDGADEPIIDPMHAAELLHEFAEHFLFLAENAPQIALALQKDWRQYDFPFIFEVDVKDWSKVGLTPHQLDMVVYAAELVAQDGELNYAKWFELARCASREPFGNAERLRARLMAAAGTPADAVAFLLGISDQVALAHIAGFDQAAGEYGLRYQRAVNILLTGVREKNKKYEQAKKKP